MEKDILNTLRADKALGVEQMVKVYQPYLLRLACVYLPHALAQEAVQDAWVCVTQAVESFEGRSSLKSWLYRIVVNACLSRLQSKSPEAMLAQGMTISADTRSAFDETEHWANPITLWDNASPEAILANQELILLIQKKINELPEYQQHVLILHDFEGLKCKEICNTLDTSESNARVLLHRARTRLYECIDRYQRGKNVNL